jgi:hypothetical protein
MFSNKKLPPPRPSQNQLNKKISGATAPSEPSPKKSRKRSASPTFSQCRTEFDQMLITTTPAKIATAK